MLIMLLVSIEGNLIDNIIIQDDQLLFSDVDLKEDVFYKLDPVNEYMFNTDSYCQANIFLYSDDYLGFYKPSNIEAFKIECINKFKSGITSFRYNGLAILLEEIEDNKEIIIKP